MKKSDHLPYLGHREIVDGKAGDYVWQTFNECDEIIDSYSRALVHENLLSVTDGTLQRSDGTPVFCFCRLLYRSEQLAILLRIVLQLFFPNMEYGVQMAP